MLLQNMANGRTHMYKCVVSRNAYGRNGYNNVKINYYSKLVKQIYLVTANFHMIAVFIPSLPSDISVCSLVNWYQEGPYGSVW